MLIETSQSAAERPTRHKANARTASFIFELMRRGENFAGFIFLKVVCFGDFCSLEFCVSQAKVSENKVARWRIIYNLKDAYRRFCKVAEN